MKKKTFLLFFTLFSIIFSSLKSENRQMEFLNRGLVAIKVSNGVFLSWRLLGTDNQNTAFNIYRNGTSLANTNPITNSTNFIDPTGNISDTYTVKAILNGIENESENNASVSVWGQQYKTIQLNRPANGRTLPNQYGSVGKTATGTFPNGQPYGYSPNDCSVGDLDGDGEYEIIVKWDPSNSQDNSYYGITGNVYLDAYKMDGTQLWRIDLGKNIRAGAHYTQFMVYDYDGDGLAELICKTAPGTIDAQGKNVIMNNDDPTADYRNLDYSQTSGSRMLGTVLSGPEYLTLFDGQTGEELNTIAYNPARGSISSWGDSYGNRADRFLACVAYLDGVHPSAVMCRGYYQKATLAAYDVVDKKLVQRWFYDSGTTSGVGAYGQGNHNLSVADVDGDGKDEIIYGSCAIDDNGTCLYRTGMGHGDAMHVSDMDPDRPGLEVWDVHEDASSAYRYEMHDAGTGAVIWGASMSGDNGRGMAGDIDASHRGFEMWSSSGSGTFSCNGTQISTKKPSVNFRIYWDADLQDELLDGTKLDKWTGNGTSRLVTFSGVSSCNSTKSTPNLSVDILGDWREEVILWETSDSSKIRIYTTTNVTTNKLFTPMHDPVYRLGVAWQNTAYNQPPHLGFYIGDGLENIPLPNITTIKYNPDATALSKLKTEPSFVYYSNGRISINSTEIIESVSVYSVLGNLVFQNNRVGTQTYDFGFQEANQVYIIKIKTKLGIQITKIL